MPCGQSLAYIHPCLPVKLHQLDSNVCFLGKKVVGDEEHDMELKVSRNLNILQVWRHKTMQNVESVKCF